MKKINREQLMNRVKLSDEELAKVTGGSIYADCYDEFKPILDKCIMDDYAIEGYDPDRCIADYFANMDACTNTQ